MSMESSESFDMPDTGIFSTSFPQVVYKHTFLCYNTEKEHMFVHGWR